MKPVAYWTRTLLIESPTQSLMLRYGDRSDFDVDRCHGARHIHTGNYRSEWSLCEEFESDLVHKRRMVLYSTCTQHYGVEYNYFYYG